MRRFFAAVGAAFLLSGCPESPLANTLELYPPASPSPSAGIPVSPAEAVAAKVWLEFEATSFTFAYPQGWSPQDMTSGDLTSLSPGIADLGYKGVNFMGANGVSALLLYGPGDLETGRKAVETSAGEYQETKPVKVDGASGYRLIILAYKNGQPIRSIVYMWAKDGIYYSFETGNHGKEPDPLIEAVATHVMDSWRWK